MKPHKHAELIKAWADGAEIQMKDKYGDWFDTGKNLTWYEEREFRIKPKDKFEYIYIVPISDGWAIVKEPKDYLRVITIQVKDLDFVCAHQKRIWNDDDIR